MSLLLCIVFVVLLMFWLFSGYTGTQPNPPGWALAANSFIPWACVAILGYMVFAGVPPPNLGR
jgi:hypothetical protein